MGATVSKTIFKTDFTGAPYLTCCDDRRCFALRDLLGTTAAEHRYLDPITIALRKITGSQMAIVMTLDETMGQVIAESGWPHGHLARPMSFCAWSLVPVYPEVLVVQDATQDARFRQNPAVLSAPYLRFYAGAPLLDDENNRLGSLCCIDTIPREIDAETCSLLCNFADVVVQKIKQKKISSERTNGFALVRIDQNEWPIQYCCDVFTELLGLELNDPLWSKYCLPGRETRQDSMFVESIVGDTFKVNVVRRNGSGKEVWSIKFSPAWKSDGRRRISFLEASNDRSHNIRKLYFAHVSQNKRTKSQLTVTDSWQQTLTGHTACPISNLEVLTAIARGGFGSVHKGRLRDLEVAVKIVPVRPNFDSSLEATLALSLDHKNVVKTFEYAVAEDGSGWFVMELCTGGSLLTSIDNGRFRTNNSFFDGTVDLQKVYITAKEIASGIKCLHDNGILHGDLKSNNILLDDNCVAKVADFGMSRAIVDDSIVTESVGTMTHMPPELLTEGIMTKAVDIYSYGVILWEMLTSQRAWAGMRPAMIITNKINGKRLQWPEAIPDVVKELSENCMADARSDRPTIDDVLQILDSNMTRMRRRSMALELPEFPVYSSDNINQSLID